MLGLLALAEYKKTLWYYTKVEFRLKTEEIMEVIIRIESNNFIPGCSDPDTINIVTKGSFEVKNGAYILNYTEPMSEGEGDVTTTITVDSSNVVDVMRSGKNSSRLTVEKGRRHLCNYDTGYGCLMIGLYGEQIKSCLNGNSGEILMRYTLDVNSEYQSLNELKVNFEAPPKSGDSSISV